MHKILKIGKLLILVFSNAGSMVITNNITSPTDYLEIQTDGDKTMALFGFCDIRGFEEMTEVLKTDIMIFVNEIAFLVHSRVDKFKGSANKNLGDCFLLVWSLPEGCIGEDEDHVFIVKNKISSQYAEFALTCFVNIIVDICSSKSLLNIAHSHEVQSKLPGYELEMGFGLHIGWAIEGAIGSDIKIDASYLSPNVNLSSRLEVATYQFNVPILFSDKIYELLTESTQKYIRMIDRVTVKGSNCAMDIYTINFLPNFKKVVKKLAMKNKNLDLTREELKQRIDKYKSVLDKALDIFDKEMSLEELAPDLVHYLDNDEYFLEEYEEGLEYYLSGNWNRAWSVWRDVLADRPKDGPTLTLMKYLELHNKQCPEDWRGYRPLTSK